MSLSLAFLNELMGIVPDASEHGVIVDHMLEFCHWFMTLLFVGWGTFFVFVLWRFHHKRNPKANYHGVKSKISAHLEFTVVLIEAALLLGFGIPLWARRVNDFPEEQKQQALRIHAVGEQFAWNFHYPGPDGVFGKQDARFITPSNPLGLDPNDPSGADDLISKNELHVANMRPTVIEVTSKDVIHSLALVNMRSMQDAIPGVRVPMWFRPVKAGTYEVVCAQLCGAGHYSMKALMMVEPQATFDQWQADTMKMQHPNLAGPAVPAPVVGPAPGSAAPGTILVK